MGDQTGNEKPDRKLEWLKIFAKLADAASRVLELLRH
jgi:hypothetical protein